MQIEKITSEAGRFMAISQLLLNKYDVRIIVGRSKHINIFVFMPETERMYKLDIRTTYGNPSKSKDFGETLSWTMGSSEEERKDSNLLYFFVHLHEKGKDARFFIVPSETVQKYIKKSHAYWLDSPKNRKDNEIRKFRLGFAGNKYAIPTPLAEDFENKWSYLE